MSLTIPSSVTALLPSPNVHPHGHGHKKGEELDLSTDSTSSTAAQVPVGSVQSLFGKAFTALQQLLGVQPPSVASTAAPSSTPVSSNAAAVASSAALSTKVNLMA